MFHQKKTQLAWKLNQYNFMELHTLKRKNPNKKARQVGRGGTRGKTSGRGGKGQTARAGNKRRPELRDIIKKLPKLRGYRTRSFEKKNAHVNLGALEIFDNGRSEERRGGEKFK